MQRPESPAALEEGPKRDKGYRRYASNVERALSLFDTALQEWADYIAFLGRLLKALQSKPQDTAEIPHKPTVAKRLAQCLAPSLPAGVHQKTLEIYAFVFLVLGKDGLSRDLPLWLPGLCPILSFASLSIKPALLSLFETFVVSLDPKILRSALKAILLALLPGLEEEASEEFERTLNLLNRFRNAVSKQAKSPNGADIVGNQNFWQSLFLATITSSTRRQGGLAYLSRELPRMRNASISLQNTQFPRHKDGMQSIEHPFSEIDAVISPEPGLLVRCFITGLQDEQLLIQRGFLDLLVSHLPLHSSVLQERVSSKDLELIITAAASVVIRRDMSLNRRLWSWFLGPEKSTEKTDSTPSSPSPSEPGSPKVRSDFQNPSQTDHFERYGLRALTHGIIQMLNAEVLAPSEKARPFKICLSLMDRWEIGGLVIPHIFVPAMESIWRYQKIAPSKDAVVEVLRSANMFFDGIESGIIWAEITQILIGAIGPRNQNNDAKARTRLAPSDLLDLVLFIITKFNVHEEEMLALHVPIATLALLINIRSNLRRTGSLPEPTFSSVSHACKIAVQLLDMIPSKVLQTSDSSQPTQLPGDSDQLLKDIELYYQRLQEGSEFLSPPPSIGVIRDSIHQNVIEIAITILNIFPVPVPLLVWADSLLEKIVHKTRLLARHEYEALISSVIPALEKLGSDTAYSLFPNIVSLLSVLQKIKNASSSEHWDSDRRVRGFLPKLLHCLWQYSSPSSPKHNVEAVRCLWHIHWISPDPELVEGSISTLLLQNNTTDSSQGLDIENSRRFVTIWAHSNSAAQSSGNHHRNVSRSIGGPDVNAAVTASDLCILDGPLLLLLDSLFDPKTELFTFVISWLQSLSSMQRIVDIVFDRLCDSVFLQEILTREGPLAGASTRIGDHSLGDAELCLYYLQMTSQLIKHSGPLIWASLEPPMTLGNADFASKILDSKEPVVLKSNFLVKACIGILEFRPQFQGTHTCTLSKLRQNSIEILHDMLMGTSYDTLLEVGLDSSLFETLSWSVEQADILLQKSLMELVLVYVKRRSAIRHRRQSSQEKSRSDSQDSLPIERNAKDRAATGVATLSSRLVDCLVLGISSPSSHPILEQWISFMSSCLGEYAASAFQSLMPLVDCFIKATEAVFQRLRTLFEGPSTDTAGDTDQVSSINSLLNGLELVLSKGHTQLLQDEGHVTPMKSPEQVQGFFGHMVSGVFAPEAQKSRALTANNRLTVLLCFKDAVAASFNLWSWGDVGSEMSSRETMTSASFHYISLRLRNRTRRILDHLFAAEVLECLETLVEIWWERGSGSATLERYNTVFNLLHALEGSRPKYTIPALFNAIYSRTNPNVLEPARKSSLTSELSDSSLATFLVAFIKSMEDDALDEIWVDCMTFLRDVLGNPLPHRQTLPILLQFTAILGEKINNTHFGEQRRMRRDIGELFVRLLAATFTVTPLSFAQDLSLLTNGDNGVQDSSRRKAGSTSSDSADFVSTIASILPNISKVLVDADRISAAVTTISSQILMPTFRGKSFPHNVSRSTLNIILTMSRMPEASKIWRKDIAEAFNDPKFFHSDSMDLIRTGWMPVLRQWAVLDKDRMADILSRLTAPASAGIVFGVGATSARQEADRKTQLNLRRVAMLILSANHDTFVVNLSSIQEKLVDLMGATVASSPSSITRAETYMVIRSLVQRITPIHLASLWPVISADLNLVFSSLSPAHKNDGYNIVCVLQAAKLLNTLLLMAPDDFQLREWLFITDTIDAVYRPLEWKPTALVDELADILDTKAGTPRSAVASTGNTQQGLSSLLTLKTVRGVPTEDIVDEVLRPFLRQLSIATFESTYQMEAVDYDVCANDLLHDLFDPTTLVQ